MLGGAALGLAVGGVAATPGLAGRLAPGGKRIGAAVPTAWFGLSLPLVRSAGGRTHDELGFAFRRFRSFLEAADKAAVSRLYGGIHFRAAIENGLAQGRRIGRAVSRLRLRG
jgi:hypothetical protein